MSQCLLHISMDVLAMVLSEFVDTAALNAFDTACTNTTFRVDLMCLFASTYFTTEFDLFENKIKRNIITRQPHAWVRLRGLKCRDWCDTFGHNSDLNLTHVKRLKIRSLFRLNYQRQLLNDCKNVSELDCHGVNVIFVLENYVHKEQITKLRVVCVFLKEMEYWNKILLSFPRCNDVTFELFRDTHFYSFVNNYWMGKMSFDKFTIIYDYVKCQIRRDNNNQLSMCMDLLGYVMASSMHHQLQSLIRDGVLFQVEIRCERSTLYFYNDIQRLLQSVKDCCTCVLQNEENMCVARIVCTPKAV